MGTTGATTGGRTHGRTAAGAGAAATLRTVEAEWAFIEGPGRRAVALLLSVDLASGACVLMKRAAGAAVVVREEVVEVGAIEVEASERGTRAVTVPGVLIAVGTPGRAAGFARSAWVDAMAPAAGCCEVVGLRIA